MKRAAIAGFAAGAAMMIGGALGAVSGLGETKSLPNTDSEIMNPMIGGQAMLPDRDLMANVAASPEHLKLTAALRDSGIAAILKSNREFTLFAPTDDAFAADIPTGNKAQLAHRIGYLVVPGNYDSTALLQLIGQGGGEAKLRTIDGGFLIVRMNGPTNIQVMDERGHTADIAIYDIHDRNGVMHVLNAMVAPAGPPHQFASNN